MNSNSLQVFHILLLPSFLKYVDLKQSAILDYSGYTITQVFILMKLVNMSLKLVLSSSLTFSIEQKLYSVAQK